VEIDQRGVMALDMEDRIESWNAQMEVMYAVPDGQTMTQPLKAIFPPEFVGRVQSHAAEPWQSHNL